MEYVTEPQSICGISQAPKWGLGVAHGDRFYQLSTYAATNRIILPLKNSFLLHVLWLCDLYHVSVTLLPPHTGLKIAPTQWVKLDCVWTTLSTKTLLCQWQCLPYPRCIFLSRKTKTPREHVCTLDERNHLQAMCCWARNIPCLCLITCNRENQEGLLLGML